MRQQWSAPAERARKFEVGAVAPEATRGVSLQPEGQTEGGIQSTRNLPHQLVEFQRRFRGHGAEGGSDGNKARIARVGRGIDMVAWGKESIESLYEVGIPMKEHGHALYYSGCIDSGSNMSIPSWDRKRDQDAMKDPIP